MDDKMFNQEKKDTLIKFIKQTKNGDYAQVGETSLKYSRVKESRNEYNDEEQYLYSLTNM